MPRVLHILQLGHPLLRQKALRVENILDANVQTLIDDMLHTVGEAKGMGLAAPQVGESTRIMILASQPNSRYPYAPFMEPTAMINPEIIEFGKTVEKDWEGCLTVPGLRGLVPRSTKIRVSYSSREGKNEKRDFEGFIARVFQHELDHLDGLVFLDRVETTRDLMMEQEWQKLIERGDVGQAPSFGS